MNWYSYLLFFFFSPALCAQINPDWVATVFARYRGGNSVPFHRDPQLATDAAGYTYSCGFSHWGYTHDLLFLESDTLAQGNENHPYFVSQVDREGNPRWLKRFSGLQTNFYAAGSPMRILSNPAGGAKVVSMVSSPVVYGGDTIAQINSSNHLFIGDLDTLGNMVASRVLRTSIHNLSTVKRAADGDILLAGTFRDGFCRVGSDTLISRVSPSYFVARLSSGGDVKWLQKIVPEARWQVGLGIEGLLETSRGEVVVATNSWSFNTFFLGTCPEENSYAVLQALDGASGAPVWQRDLLAATASMVTDMKEAANGDLYLTGAYSGQLRASNGQRPPSIHPADCNRLNGFRMWVSPQGQVLQVIGEEGGFLPHKIEILANGSYATLGKISRIAFQETDQIVDSPGIVLNLYAPNNELLSSQLLVETHDEESGIDMIQQEGHLIVAGNYFGNLAGLQLFDPLLALAQKWIFMAKLDVGSLTDFPLAAAIQRADISIFPNPTSDVLNIAVQDKVFELEEVRIYNAAGQLLEVIPQAAGRTQLSIGVGHLLPGAYFLQLGRASDKIFFQFLKQ